MSRTRVAFGSASRWERSDNYRDRFPIVDRDSELAYLGGVGRQDDSFDVRFAKVHRSSSDPLYAAVFVSKSTFETTPPARIVSVAGAPTVTGPQSLRVLRLWQQMVEVCDQGARLEQDNAYFPAMAAAAANGLGRQEDVRARLAIAAQRGRFDSHASELTKIYQRTAIRAMGYRGIDLLPIADDCDWSLYLSGLASAVGHLPNDDAGVRLKSHMLRVADLIYQGAHADRELEWAARLIFDLTGVDPDHNVGPGRARERHLDGVSKLARALKPDDPGPLNDHMRAIIAAGDHSNIERVTKYPGAPAWEAIYEYSFMDSMPEYASVSMAFLIAGLFAIATLAVLAIVPGRIPLRLLPFLAAAALSFSGLFAYKPEPSGLSQAVLLAGIYVVAGLCALDKRAGPYAVVAAVVGPVVALRVMPGGPASLCQAEVIGHPLLPVLAFPLYVGLCAWRARRGTSSKLLFAPQLAVLCLILGLVAVVGFLGSWELAAGRFIVLVITVVATVAAFQAMSLSECARQMRRCAYWPIAVSALCSGLTLTGTVWNDAQRWKEAESWETSAAPAREWAQSHPDGLLPELRRLEAERGRW